MTFSDNASIVIVFTLSGLDEMMDYRVTLFSLTFLCYIVIILLNVALITTIILDHSLHEPMYIHLCNLCISALIGTAGFYPKFLLDLLSHSHVISYAGCLVQAIVVYYPACCDFCILSVMAYDRYVAICRPLEYHSVMTKQRVSHLASYPWLSTGIFFITAFTLSSRRRLCGSHIDKLYCDNWSIVKLSCTSTTPNNIAGYFAILFYFGHFVFILWSYVYLLRSCLKSIENRGKFIETCLPHLLSLLNVTVALLFDLMYTRYGSRNLPQSLKNFLAIEFLIVPPVLNPLLYGLKLTQIQNRILRLSKRDKSKRTSKRDKISFN